MHTLQKLLITRLVTQNGLSYSALTKGYDAEDNIVFHLKQLVSKGFFEKKQDKYFLTAAGISTLNTFQKTDLQDNPFKMTFVGFICSCETTFLLKAHKSDSPFYNLPSGSPLFGENLQTALSRIFYDISGINVAYEDFIFDSLHMKTVRTTTGETFFDDAFVVYQVEISESQKDKMLSNQDYVWLHKDEIANLEHEWPEIDYCILRKNWEIYKVYDVICDYILV